MRFIIRCLISAVTLVLVSYLIPGIGFDSFLTVVLAALVLGIINAVIRPLILFLTLPLNILTLGLFTFVVNGLMLWLVHMLLSGFEILNFSSAIWGAIVYWIVNWIINILFESE
jgi:putative membrane protein